MLKFLYSEYGFMGIAAMCEPLHEEVRLDIPRLFVFLMICALLGSLVTPLAPKIDLKPNYNTFLVDETLSPKGHRCLRGTLMQAN
jgi:hypothetical protein